MTTPKYQVIVKNKVGDTIGEFSDIFNLTYSDVLDNYGIASFDVPITSQDVTKLVSLRRFEVYIVREGKIEWSGEQANADVTIKTDDANLITITCYTFPEMLNSRYTVPYIRFDPAIDQSEILKAIVDESQSRPDGDLGLTFATITPTMDRIREYQLSNILEAYVNMSNIINGVDFWIDSNKVIHTSSSRGSDKSLQYGLELGVNIQEARITDNFSSPANTVFAIGASDGFQQLIESYVDIAARGTYKLREQVISAIDVSETDTLIGKAEDYVNKNKNQVRTVKIDQLPNTSPTIDKLTVGDSMNVKVKKGRYDIDNPYRIYGYECKIGDVGEENVSWILGRI